MFSIDGAVIYFLALYLDVPTTLTIIVIFLKYVYAVRLLFPGSEHATIEDGRTGCFNRRRSIRRRYERSGVLLLGST